MHDGDALEALLGDRPSHGTLQLEADGSFTYVPDENFLGRDSFTYQVTDGQAESPFATVVIDVVARPVSIRLEAVDSNDNPITEVVADESICRSDPASRICGLRARRIWVSVPPTWTLPMTSSSITPVDGTGWTTGARRSIWFGVPERN